MSAERGFADFTAAWERGERPDPATAIAAAAPADREPLAAMIAAYLAAHPRTDVSAEEVAARAADPRSEPPRAWAELLPGAAGPHRHHPRRAGDRARGGARPPRGA